MGTNRVRHSSRYLQQDGKVSLSCSYVTEMLLCCVLQPVKCKEIFQVEMRQIDLV